MIQMLTGRVTGLDAIGRVLKRARKEGMKEFGHSYKTEDGSSGDQI